MKATQNKLVLFAVIALLPLTGLAQTYDTNGDYVQTFAGSGFSGYLDGVGQQTMFNVPNLIVADSRSNLFVWDSGNYRIREIAPNGTVTTFVGGGSQATGVGTNVNLSGIGLTVLGLAIDHNNTLWAYSLDTLGSVSLGLYEITSSGVVTRTNLFAFQGPLIVEPPYGGICADSIGNIYLSVEYTNQIYRYATNGVLSLFVGSGNQGYADGNGIFTAFNNPTSLTADSANNIYVWDAGNHLIRRIDPNANVTTISGQYNTQGASTNADGVGTNAIFSSQGYFNAIYQMCCDNSGNLYLASGCCVRKINVTTNVVTLAGSFTQTGYANGAGNLALFNGADGVCETGGTIYVADSSNQRIRDITFNSVPQIVSPANLSIGTYVGVNITGIVGRTYEIESAPSLTNAWTVNGTVLLTSSPYVWIDPSPVAGNKFYQALLMP